MEMSRFETSLLRLEGTLRGLIEGAPATDGIPRKLHHQLEQALVTAMRSEAHIVSGENRASGKHHIAPAQYTLVLPIEQAEMLLNHPRELDILSEKLEFIASQNGIALPGKPILRVVAAPGSIGVKVLAENQLMDNGSSHTLEIGGLPDSSSLKPASRIPKAFLIVNGLVTYPLTQPVINIGRNPSNHVHLDDPRVSRVHAQLRLIKGRFVLFDLDSLGGTFVNDVAVNSHILKPGDVILMAGVPLVYGEEEDTRIGFTQELPVNPP